MARDDDLFTDFDDRTDDVSRSTYDFFRANLERWFAFLDETPEFAPAIQDLEELIDYRVWSKTGLVEQEGMGHGRIALPNGQRERLSALLGLFRSLTNDEDAGWRFAHEYVSSSRHLNDNIADLVSKLFEPFARDLRRHLERNLASAPASDRTVPLNHNAPAYRELIEALDKLERALVGLNDYDDADDKAQRIAEISAGRRLLEAPRTRLDAVRITVGAGLKYIAKKFADTALGKLALVAIEKLLAAIPSIASYFW